MRRLPHETTCRPLLPDSPVGAGTRNLRLTCRSTLPEIRTTLLSVTAFLRKADAPDEWAEDMGIILAEAMTNVARHGYRDRPGRIDLSITLDLQSLYACICDEGDAFDVSSLGRVAPDPDALQEGGYGWFLIRSLSEKLRYQRRDGINKLEFWVPVRAPLAETIDGNA
jgi:serine/threonine-protein kinase RsbW